MSFYSIFVSFIQGVSFLEVKYQVLLSYLRDLTFLMYHKCQGKSIQDNPAIDRLVEMRTVSNLLSTAYLVWDIHNTAIPKRKFHGFVRTYKNWIYISDITLKLHVDHLDSACFLSFLFTNVLTVFKSHLDSPSVRGVSFQCRFIMWTYNEKRIGVWGLYVVVVK